MKKKCRVLEIQKNRDINVAAFKQVLEKKCEALVLRTQLQIENQDFSNVLSNLDSIAQHVIRHKNLSIYPLSYAVIHEKKATEESNELLKKFFKESVKANEIINQLASGKISPLCLDISNIFNKLAKEKSNNLVNANILDLCEPNHVISLLDYTVKGNRYIFTIDIQNGILEPLPKKDSSFVTLETLPLVCSEDVFLYAFEDSVLKKKRNLMNTLLPCNFLSDLYDDDFTLKGSDG